MDSTTLIRVISGVLFIVILGVLVMRRKKMA
jgi:LPXTG-motif cell wall-anchored protein